MKLSNELRELPIVSISEGEEVGIVKDFIVDPIAKAVVALVVADDSWYAGAKVISFSLINSIGDYAITTENASSVVDLANMPELIDLLKKELNIIDARVITRGGRFVGRVSEYSINKESGEILGIELAGDADIPAPDKNIIPADSIVTIGKHVIIVSDEIDASLAASHQEINGSDSFTPPPAPTPVAAEEPVFEPEPMAAPEPESEPEPEPEPQPEPQQIVDEDMEDIPDIEDLVLDDEQSFEAEPEPEPEAEEAPSGGIGEDDDDVDIEDLLDLDSAAEASGMVEEPDERAPEAPVLEEPEDETKESLSEIFERRQIKYMLGKKVSRDIDTDDGIKIASQGDVITEDIIDKAKKSGKFLELSMNIEIED